MSERNDISYTQWTTGKFGDKRCKNGSECTSYTCGFAHPEDWFPVSSVNATPKKVTKWIYGKFGDKKCRDGNKCKSRTCGFSHPEGSPAPPPAPSKPTTNKKVVASGESVRTLLPAFEDSFLSPDQEEEVLAAIYADQVDADQVDADQLDADDEDDDDDNDELGKIESDVEITAEKAAEYVDTMKIIEKNREKNEAKRATQSARNAEIIDAFEKRT